MMILPLKLIFRPWLELFRRYREVDRELLEDNKLWSWEINLINRDRPMLKMKTKVILSLYKNIGEHLQQGDS